MQAPQRRQVARLEADFVGEVPQARALELEAALQAASDKVEEPRDVFA